MAACDGLRIRELRKARLQTFGLSIAHRNYRQTSRLGLVQHGILAHHVVAVVPVVVVAKAVVIKLVTFEVVVFRAVVVNLVRRRWVARVSVDVALRL